MRHHPDACDRIRARWSCPRITRGRGASRRRLHESSRPAHPQSRAVATSPERLSSGHSPAHPTRRRRTRRRDLPGAGSTPGCLTSPREATRAVGRRLPDGTRFEVPIPVCFSGPSVWCVHGGDRVLAPTRQWLGSSDSTTAERGGLRQLSPERERLHPLASSRS